MQIPIRALSYVGCDEARLAQQYKYPQKELKTKIANMLVADWMNPNAYEYEVYNRFDPSNPFKFPTAIAFNGDKTFSRWIYSFNDWFKGLFDWIKASNLSP